MATGASVFCQIDGVKGESKDDGHKDWIEVLSFNYGIHQPTAASASSSGGGTTERADHRDVVFTRDMDKCSPELLKLCTEGKHIAKVVFDFMRSDGGKGVLYFKVEMENVVISNISVGHRGTGVPTEEVSLNFGKIKWTYDQQNRSGGGSSGKVVAGWDLEAWKPWA